MLWVQTIRERGVLVFCIWGCIHSSVHAVAVYTWECVRLCGKALSLLEYFVASGYPSCEWQFGMTTIPHYHAITITIHSHVGMDLNPSPHHFPQHRRVWFRFQSAVIWSKVAIRQLWNVKKRFYFLNLTLSSRLDVMMTFWRQALNCFTFQTSRPKTVNVSQLLIWKKLYLMFTVCVSLCMCVSMNSTVMHCRGTQCSYLFSVPVASVPRWRQCKE